MQSVFENGGIVGVTMDFGATTSYEQTGEVIDFYDDFETFTGWTTQGTGVVTQSSTQAYSGTYSAYKQTNGDPNGAYKLLTNSVNRDYTLETWFYSVSPRGTTAADRISIVNSSGNGYGFYVNDIAIYVERRTSWTASTISSISYTRTDDVWYRATFTANTNNTFTVNVYNISGTLTGTLTSSADATYAGPFDRVAILGGNPYYVDNLKVFHIGVTGNKKNSGIWNLNASYNYLRSIDPYFSSVSLLLHGEGTNNGTTFTDSSTNNFTMTVNGNAVTSTTQFKYGSSSMYFDGNGDYLLATDNGAFDFGTGDFTVEAWVYITSFVTDANSVVAGRGPTNGDWMFAIRSASQVSWGRNQVAWDATSSGITLSTNTWYHTAVSRTSGVLKIFVNGTQYYSATNTQTYSIANSTLAVGGRQLTSSTSTVGNFFNGYIDDLRITKGIGRYTTAFTPPTQQFPDS